MSHTFDLLTYYSLETEHYPQAPTKVQVLDRWLKTYSEQWVRLALIESLYQGRYKAFSVEQLLSLWRRRGEPVYHFSEEFEELVCHDVPRQMDRAMMPPQGDGVAAKAEPSALKTTPSKQDPVIEQSVVEQSVSVPQSEPESVSVVLQPQGLEKQSDLSDGDVSALLADWGDGDEADLATLLGIDKMLPITVGRLGLVPILQFMPDAQSAEFCEKLEAIARPQP